MDNETKFATFKLGLETEMQRIESSHKDIYGDRPNALTAQKFTELHLPDDLSWETDTDGQGNVLRCCRAVSAP
jgi:hypothetical protein